MKTCQSEDCSNYVFSKGFCKWHQNLRTDKKKPKSIRPISKKKLENKPERTEMDVFLELWEERPHVSELSGLPLLPKGNIKWHFQFLHVLPKGKFPSLRLSKKNILLGTPEEHDHQDRFEAFRKRKVELLKEIYGTDLFI